MGKYKICQKYIIFLACLFSQMLCGSHQRLIWRNISDSWMQLCFLTEKIILLSDKEFSCWEKNPKQTKTPNSTKQNSKSLWTAIPKQQQKSVSHRNYDTP